MTVAIVGGGVAGLAAAHEVLRRGGVPIVLEATDRVGGKLRTSEVAGVQVDEGADSLLRRVPEGVDLVATAGLDLTTPATGQAALWLGGSFQALPTGTVMGIPTDLAAVASLVGDLTEVRRPLPTEDVSVGALVRAHLGPLVLDRLVDPLLGGVYAGRADALSVQMALPQLWAHLRGDSLVDAARAARGTPSPGPVFAGVPGGLGVLPAALARDLDVRLHTTVTGLSRTPTGWRLETGSAAAPAALEADAVLLAVPGAAAGRLLAGFAAAPELEYASVALVTLVLDGPTPGTGSGYLVPAGDERLTKAVTFSSRKWDRPGPAVVRASVGRAGQERDLQRDDADLVAAVTAELIEAVGPLPPYWAPGSAVGEGGCRSTPPATSTGWRRCAAPCRRASRSPVRRTTEWGSQPARAAGSRLPPVCSPERLPWSAGRMEPWLRAPRPRRS